MPNGDQPDKVVRITLDGSGMPIPDQNRVKVKQDKQKVKVSLSMFGRATSVELDFAQVEKA